ncbi:unnamed protein product, partial [Polarella glacialis]
MNCIRDHVKSKVPAQLYHITAAILSQVTSAPVALRDSEMLVFYVSLAAATAVALAAKEGKPKLLLEVVSDADGISLLQAQSHSVANCLPPGFRSAVVKNEGVPFSMAVLTHPDIVSEAVASNGMWEVSGVDGMASRAQAQLPASGTFLDIGANLDIAGLVKVVPVALSDKQEVPVRTLDSVLAELKPSSIDAVKIDIEGHECKVLASGGSLFSKYAPKLVQVETNVGDSLNCVKHAAASFSYQVRSLGGDTALIPALKLFGAVEGSTSMSEPTGPGWNRRDQQRPATDPGRGNYNEQDDCLDSLLRVVNGEETMVCGRGKALPRRPPQGWATMGPQSCCCWVPTDLPHAILLHFVRFLYAETT